MKSESTSAQISPLFLLGLILILLKVAGHLEWPWLWVLAPFWGPIAIVLSIAAIITVGGLLLAGAILLIEWKGSK